ncbi:MAG: nuclear transport factor 2 family protein [Longimicrobiales bacterium]
MPDARAVLESWFEAMETRNIEKITELLAEDISVETESLKKPLTDKQVLRAILARTMDAYQSIRIDPRKIVSSGQDVAALVSLRVRFGADIDLMGEKLPTAGKSIDVVAAIFLEVNEAGKIARIMRVRDTWGIIDQLGLAPERVKEAMQKFEAALKEPRSRAA